MTPSPVLNHAKHTLALAVLDLALDKPARAAHDVDAVWPHAAAISAYEKML